MKETSTRHLRLHLEELQEKKEKTVNKDVLIEILENILEIQQEITHRVMESEKFDREYPNYIY
jgi:hypothetical protein